MDYEPLPDETCKELMIDLFEAIPQLIEKVMPDGFAVSSLVRVFHPSAEQQYKEYLRMRSNLNRLSARIKKEQEKYPIPDFEEYVKDIEPSEIKENYEIVSIYGDCIWEIFSKNHTVFNQNFQSYDLGSWRGSGRFIADVINELGLVSDFSFDYLDFYMGQIFSEERADFTPIYEFIFKRLQQKNLDWEYSFPQMQLISFQKEDQDSDEPEKYDASEALQKELDRNKEKEEMNELREKFDKIHEEEYEKARYIKPSQKVMAFFNVYGHWPKGHPLDSK